MYFTRCVISKDFQTDSPHCSRIGIQSTLLVLTSIEWHLKSADVKTAFLQGKKSREKSIYDHQKKPTPNKIWRLQKWAYGLAEARKYWYLRVKEDSIKLGAIITSSDQGIFFRKGNTALEGIHIYHVDDIVYGGANKFE